MIVKDAKGNELLEMNILWDGIIGERIGKSLAAVLKGKWFEISLIRDETWEEMIEYGAVHANVERRYLETIPLHI